MDGSLGKMRLPVIHALFTLVASSSCILVLDFEDRGTSGGGSDLGGSDLGGSGSGGEPAVGGHGGDGGGAPLGSAWVTTLTATRFSESQSVDSRVSVKSVVVSGDTTWIGGYFFGKDLQLRDHDGAQTTIMTSATGVTTFVLALDAEGKLSRAIPLASSAEPAELAFDEWLGTKLDVDGAGNVYVLSSYRGGETAFDADDPVAGSPQSFDLLMLKLDAEGEVEWASTCAGRQVVDAELTLGASLSANYAEIRVLGDEQIAFGTTVEASTDIQCTALRGTAGPCELPPQLEQSGLIGTLSPDGTCDGGALQLTSHLPGPAGAPIKVWLDGMALDASGEVLFSGRVFQGGGVLEPWGTTADAGTPLAFAGSLALDGGGRIVPPRFFHSDSRPFLPSGEDVIVGTVVNPAAVTDVLISRSTDELQLGDPGDDDRSEIVETMSSRDGYILIGGTLSEGSTMKQDLCGAACDGDLQQSDTGCAFGASRDGFWLLLDPANNAIGRSFGDCSRQTVVGSQLGEQSLTLAIELEGEMTLDLLEGEKRKIAGDPHQRVSLIARLPRPAAP